MDALSFLDSDVRPYDDLVQAASRQHGLPAEMIHGLIATESAYDPRAVSPKGALGLTQLMPGTARGLGVRNPHDPAQSIDGGARYLKSLLDRYGDPHTALLAYHAGERNVDNWLAGLPSDVGPKTLGYPSKVLSRVRSTASKSSSFAPPDAYAADAPRTGMSATAFLDDDEPAVPEQPSQESTSGQSAMDYLDAPEPGFTDALMDFAGDVGSALSRSAGIAFGLANSPHAVATGGLMTPYENPEEWNRMSVPEQALVALGGGFQSAWDSISKPGSWGVTVGDLVKAETGKTTEQLLPEGAKWAAPTLEFLGSLLLDPTVMVGAAESLIRNIGTKQALGDLAGIIKSTPKLEVTKLPEGLIDDLAKLEQLDEAEKNAVQSQLLDVLKQRRDYARDVTEWGERTLADVERAERSVDAVPSPSPVGLRQQPTSTYQPWQPNENPFAGLDTVTYSETDTLPQALRPAAQQAEQASPSAPFDLLERGKPAVTPAVTPRVETDIPIPAAPPKPAQALPGVEQSAPLPLSTAPEQQSGVLASLADESGAVRLPGLGGEKLDEALSQNPAWQKVHKMVGQEQSGLDVRGFLGNLETKLLDRFAPLRKVSPATYEEARKYQAFRDVAQGKFDELAAALKPVKHDQAAFTDYLLAHRAMDRARRGLKNPNKVTMADAQSAIAEIERHYAASGKDPQALKDALGAFQRWGHDYILMDALDSGIISQKAYGDIVSQNRWYATFDVLEKLPPDINKIPSGLPSSEYFSVANQDVIKKMTGTEKLIRDPVEATVKKFLDAQAIFARNRVASTFVDDPAVQQLIRPVADSVREFKIMKDKGLNPVMKGAWSKKDFDSINRFRNGRVERYVAPRELADAVKQLSPSQAPKAVQALNGIFRSAATSAYLPFTISNAMRDGLMAYSTAPVYKAQSAPTFAADWLKGLFEGIRYEFGKGSRLVNEYTRAGGGFGYVGDVRSSKIAVSRLFKKGISEGLVTVIGSPFRLIEKISASIELAPRMAVYSRAKASGMAPGDAAMLARNATVDFNRAGEWTKVANQWIPFLNARVQGRLRVAEALKKDTKSTLAKVFLSAVLPGLATYAWNRVNHSDLYDDIPEHIRQNYFVLITGTGQDANGKTAPKYLVIAKGDLGQMAMNPIEHSLDKMLHRDPASTMEFLTSYLSDLSPVDFAREGKFSLDKAAGSILPPVVKGVAEDWAGKQFYTGKQIVPRSLEDSPPELQAKKSTPQVFKWLGARIGMSPLRLQNFASNLFAGYGREGLDPEAMLRGLTGRLVRTQGGEREDRAWEIIRDIETGYQTTRAFAQEMISNGERDKALKMLDQWDAGLRSRVKEVEKFGFKDKGGLYRDFMFSPDKRKNLLMKRDDKRSPIERKLSIR